MTTLGIRFVAETTGTDAHAKNYSLLISAESNRLAPLYDIASILPYPEIDIPSAEMSTKIGDEYRLRAIRLNNWENMAGELHIDSEALVGRLNEMIDQIPDHALAISRGMLEGGLTHPIITRLADAIAARAVD